MNIIDCLLLFIFLSIAFLHIYWAMGGKQGKRLAIPSTENGIALFQPNALSCFFIGFAFILFALAVTFSYSCSLYILWLMVIIFFLRAFGDFRYIGFFKKVKNTPFATSDTLIYSPLCLLICLLILLRINIF